MRSRLLPLLLLLPVACGGDDEKGLDEGSQADRQIVVSATDALRFDPSTITAKAGETITFVVTNTGKTDHEFVIGDAEYQSGHGSGDGHGGHGDGNGAQVELPPGKTGRVTFTMPDAPPTYSCHVNDHDAAGMTGTVRY